MMSAELGRAVGERLAAMGLPLKLISRTAGGHFGLLHIALRNQMDDVPGVPTRIGLPASPTDELLFPSDRGLLAGQQWFRTSLTRSSCRGLVNVENGVLHSLGDIDEDTARHATHVAVWSRARVQFKATSGCALRG